MYKNAFKRFDKLHQENDGDIAQEIKILLIYLRRLSADELIENKLWWEGPDFLKKPESEWPCVPQAREID
jgi:hypothetical protein